MCADANKASIKSTALYQPGCRQPRKASCPHARLQEDSSDDLTADTEQEILAEVAAAQPQPHAAAAQVRPQPTVEQSTGLTSMMANKASINTSRKDLATTLVARSLQLGISRPTTSTCLVPAKASEMLCWQWGTSIDLRALACCRPGSPGVRLPHQPVACAVGICSRSAP